MTRPDGEAQFTMGGPADRSRARAILEKLKPRSLKYDLRDDGCVQRLTVVACGAAGCDELAAFARAWDFGIGEKS